MNGMTAHASGVISCLARGQNSGYASSPPLRIFRGNKEG